GAYYLLTSRLGLDPRSIFLFGGCATLAGTFFIFWLMPDSLARLFVWLLTGTALRVHAEGSENLPGKGGALLVCNHLSLVDALMVLAAAGRRIEFPFFEAACDRGVAGLLARLLKHGPINHD